MISYFCEGNFDVVAALTAAHGANLAIQKTDGNTPLHVAAEKGII